MQKDVFQNELKHFGMQFKEYGGECYFGESNRCSVVLEPLTSQGLQRARLAIRTTSGEERRAVVHSFLAAAGVDEMRVLAAALDGEEHRLETGLRCVTVAVLDDEYIVTVSK